MDKDKLAEAVKALMNMGPVKHKRIAKPTKADLERKFKLKIDAKGRPRLGEVE